MQIGFIGAGKVGCSLGRYLKEQGKPVAGYISRHIESSEFAGTFTDTKAFNDLKEMTEICDILCVATTDREIENVWKELQKQDLEDKIICHFSGSYSSAVFQGIGNKKASACSIHPMCAFSDKSTSYRQLNNVVFTMEGDDKALAIMRPLFESMGNRVLRIDSDKKVLYHCSASIVSNFMIGLYQMGLDGMEECGLTKEEARLLFNPLVRGNIDALLEKGPAQALSGPIERNDASVVSKHLQVLEEKDAQLYRLVAEKVLEVAKLKNPDKNYEEVENFL
ncbi:MAG: Rossmann-like and DUF2520 domain-containing protein [Eubacterium sp.]